MNPQFPRHLTLVQTCRNPNFSRFCHVEATPKAKADRPTRCASGTLSAELPETQRVWPKMTCKSFIQRCRFRADPQSTVIRTVRAYRVIWHSTSANFHLFFEFKSEARYSATRDAKAVIFQNRWHFLQSASRTSAQRHLRSGLYDVILLRRKDWGSRFWFIAVRLSVISCLVR